MLRHVVVVLLLQLFRCAAASPALAPAKSCSSYSSAVSCLKKNPQGTPFCSSYNKISKSTSYVTSTIRPSPVTTVITVTTTQTEPTTTVTGFVTVTTTSTVRVTKHTQKTVVKQTTVEVTSTSTFTCASTGGSISAYTLKPGATKRDVEDIAARAATPTCVKGKAAPTVSKICSCLSIKPATVTSTTTTSLPPQTITSTTTSTVRVTPVTSVIVTTTSTVITTSTSTITDPPATLYNIHTATVVQPTPAFSGFSYYQYTNTYTASNPSQTPSVLSLKSPNYLSTGIFPADTFDGYTTNSNGTCTLPGSSTLQNCTQLSLVLQAFFFAPEDGYYLIQTSEIDDFIAAYWGDVAYSAWNDTNYSYQAQSSNQDLSGNAMLFSAGQYVPFTYVYMNEGGPGMSEIEIIKFDSNGDDSDPEYQDPGSIFILPCDGSPFVP